MVGHLGRGRPRADLGGCPGQPSGGTVVPYGPEERPPKNPIAGAPWTLGRVRSSVPDRAQI